MELNSDDIYRILELLPKGPLRIAQATHEIEAAQLELRTEFEPWSVGDILAHLRACADVWGSGIIEMLTQDHPTMRYVSPRSWMRKPKYRDETFDIALETFTEERQKLVQELTELDETGWLRRGTYTGTSPRQRNQTVLSYAERIVNHEQPHLDQIEVLLL